MARFSKRKNALSNPLALQCALNGRPDSAAISFEVAVVRTFELRNQLTLKERVKKAKAKLFDYPNRVH
jgi:hypothetical protein